MDYHHQEKRPDLFRSLRKSVSSFFRPGKSSSTVPPSASFPTSAAEKSSGPLRRRPRISQDDHNNNYYSARPMGFVHVPSALSRAAGLPARVSSLRPPNENIVGSDTTATTATTNVHIRNDNAPLGSLSRLSQYASSPSLGLGRGSSSDDHAVFVPHPILLHQQPSPPSSSHSSSPSGYCSGSQDTHRKSNNNTHNHHSSVRTSAGGRSSSSKSSMPFTSEGVPMSQMKRMQERVLCYQDPVTGIWATGAAPSASNASPRTSESSSAPGNDCNNNNNRSSHTGTPETIAEDSEEPFLVIPSPADAPRQPHTLATVPPIVPTAAVDPDATLTRNNSIARLQRRSRTSFYLTRTSSQRTNVTFNSSSRSRRNSGTTTHSLHSDTNKDNHNSNLSRSSTRQSSRRARNPAVPRIKTASNSNLKHSSIRRRASSRRRRQQQQRAANNREDARKVRAALLNISAVAKDLVNRGMFVDDADLTAIWEHLEVITSVANSFREHENDNENDNGTAYDCNDSETDVRSNDDQVEARSPPTAAVLPPLPVPVLPDLNFDSDNITDFEHVLNPRPAQSPTPSDRSSSTTTLHAPTTNTDAEQENDSLWEDCEDSPSTFTSSTSQNRRSTSSSSRQTGRSIFRSTTTSSKDLPDIPHMLPLPQTHRTPTATRQSTVTRSSSTTSSQHSSASTHPTRKVILPNNILITNSPDTPPPSSPPPLNSSSPPPPQQPRTRTLRPTKHKRVKNTSITNKAAITTRSTNLSTALHRLENTLSGIHMQLQQRPASVLLLTTPQQEQPLATTTASVYSTAHSNQSALAIDKLVVDNQAEATIKKKAKSKKDKSNRDTIIPKMDYNTVRYYGM
ncbi:hypothetical protein DFJ77DRAFT_514567 [Powellomyces hirtus]|nr:hypothetical protein DFJ77DRAFT_514567 [Powellomyces hirtus]